MNRGPDKYEHCGTPGVHYGVLLYVDLSAEALAASLKLLKTQKNTTALSKGGWEYQRARAQFSFYAIITLPDIREKTA